MIAAANNRCEACDLELTHQTLCVDHDHATGHVRGVLCRFCNALEGVLNKKADRVVQVKAYVARKLVARKLVERAERVEAERVEAERVEAELAEKAPELARWAR